MNIEESKKKQSLIKEYLLEMSSKSMNEDEIEKMLQNFNFIYSNKFRHTYSEVFPLVVYIDNEDNDFSIEYLSNNILRAREIMELQLSSGSNDYKNMYPHFLKLSDHINLEIGRYSYYSQSEKKIKDLSIQNKNLKDELDSANSNLDSAIEQARSMQKEYIAILGIFASIVLAFTAEFSYASSILSNINSVSIYRLLMVSLIIGVISINLLYGLFHYIDKIVHGKDRKTTPLIVANLFLLILIIIVFFAWHNGSVEKRNYRVESNVQENYISESYQPEAE